MTLRVPHKNPIPFLILLLIIVIIFALIIIYKLNNYSNPSDFSNDFGAIKNQAINLSSDQEINNNLDYQKMLSQLTKLENQNLITNEKGEIAQAAARYLVNAYYSTNNNKLYTFAQNLKTFTQENFGNKYIINPPCYDPKCADGPQPKEILIVIEEIKVSNIPQELKDNIILDLTNYTYLKKGYGLPNYDIKIGSYFSLANTIKKDPDFIKAGLNEKIYNEIVDYLKKTYPNEYLSFIRP